MSPIEVGTALNSALQAGSSSKDLAAALHLESGTMISRFVRLLSLAPDVQLATDWGKDGATISFTAASEIARLKSKDDQSQACALALEYELTTSEVKNVIQLHQRSKKPIQECVADIVRLRPEIHRRHVFIGAIVREDLRAELDKLSQLERDRVLREAVGKRYAGLSGVAARLGYGRFSLTGDDAVAERLQLDKEGFEAGLNRTLAEIVLERQREA